MQLKKHRRIKFANSSWLQPLKKKRFLQNIALKKLLFKLKNSKMSLNNQELLMRYRLVFDIGGTLMKLAVLEESNDGDPKFQNFLNSLNDIAEEKRESIILKNVNKNLAVHLFTISKASATLKKLLDVIALHSSEIFDGEKNQISMCGSGIQAYKSDLERILEGKIKPVEVRPVEFLTSFAGIQVLSSHLEEDNKREKFYTYEMLTDIADLEQVKLCEPVFSGFGRVPVECIDDRYILVLLGTATSIVLVDGKSVTYLEHSNVTGSTYLGLCKLVCNFKTFKEATRASERGENKILDFTISDLAAATNKSIDDFDAEMKKANIRTDQVETPDIDFCISSFGKYDQSLGKASKTDVANAILKMVTNSFTLNTYQKAKAFDCKQVIYIGSFFTNNPYAAFVTAKLLRYLSKGKINAVFTKHSGYVNCIGSLYDFSADDIIFKSTM
jgi:pantothenate kinase